MIGFGFDVHQLAKGESLILAGINIDSEIGTIAHSDGDVLLHSVMDALLGAAGLGDIGDHFPEYDEKYKNANSQELTEEVMRLLKSKNYEVVNTDITLVLEAPKIRPYKDKMRENIAKLLELPLERVNIKATTNETMGFIGRKEGVVAYSVCLIKQK